MAQILTLRDAERELSKLRNELDTLRSRNINLGQRRIINAHPSVDLHDYVTRSELVQIKDELNKIDDKLSGVIQDIFRIKNRLDVLEGA